MATEKPFCQRYRAFLKGRVNLAPLTGQDTRALHAFVHMVELYACSDGAGRRAAIAGMGACGSAMQASTRHIAKATIPMVMDWSDEDRVWHKAVGGSWVEWAAQAGADAAAMATEEEAT